IVLFTLLEKDLVERLEAKCQEINIPSLSIIGPVMQLFQAYLGTETSRRVGAQHTLNAEYFKRIDALNYTMMHDDGQHVEGLEEADVV
ncbi:kinase/pyrophosphorylase, partial [Klebsiella pneumoniae]